MSAIAENESRSISENVKWGYRERFKRGEYNLGNSRILGYDSVNGKLVPNEDAGIVWIIFQMYVAGTSLQEIAGKLNSLGATGRSGRPLTEQGVMYILGNEVYVGDRRLQKRAPKNFLTKQPDNNAEYDSYYLTDDHEAIVDRGLWDTVQDKLKQRRKDIEDGIKYHGGRAHFLFGTAFCGDCGAPMTRRTLREYSGETYKSWTCRGRHMGRRGNGCKMRNIRERDLFSDICMEMGYDSGAEFPVERFQGEVNRVEVCQDGVQVLRKTADGA